MALRRQTNAKPRRLLPSVWLLWLALAIALGGCGRRETGQSETARPDEARGSPIQPPVTNQAPSAATTNYPQVDWSKPDVVEDGFIRLGYDKLSGFKYDVYEVYSETNSGRALLKSDDVIPHQVKAYDGKRVVVTGFVLPLRTKRGLVTEFLLLRDQGACCFGPQAQINHFIRVKYTPG